MVGENISPEHTIDALRKQSESEPVANFLGMKLVELADGYSKVTMTLRPEHLNFNGFIFGGIIMSLADLAFAYANNCAGIPNVASQFSIQFLSSVQAGEQLTAECNVLKKGKRVCHSEMIVTNRQGKLIAKATGLTIPIPIT